MKAAIIGLGVIGKVHYDVLKRQGEDIVALCDIDAAKLNGYDNVKKYFDYKKMLDEEQIDVVHICTPHYLHADMTIYALERNVNVLCEKPLCIRKEDVARIIDAENKSEAMLGVCLQTDIISPVNLSKVFSKQKNRFRFRQRVVASRQGVLRVGRMAGQKRNRRRRSAYQSGNTYA